jgi:hypothetical protein
MGRRVWDDGGSERLSVIGGIGIEPPVGQHYPTRKRADFHLVTRHEKVDGDTETGVRRIGSSQVAAGASLREPPETAARVSSSA